MCLSLEGQVYPKLWASFIPIHPVSYTLSTPFTQCPIPLSFTPLLNFLFNPLSSSPLSAPSPRLSQFLCNLQILTLLWRLFRVYTKSGIVFPLLTPTFFRCGLLEEWMIGFNSWFGWVLGGVWCYGCCVFLGFLLHHSPSVPSTFFYPSLKLPYPPQSFGAGISENG